MKKLLFILMLGLPAITVGQNKTGKIYNLLVGTYTTGKSQGIYVYHFDSNTGKITYQDKVTGVDNPSYLAVSHNQKFVYSVNEVGTDRKGSVSAFSFDAKLGRLVFINKQPSVGAGPCYVSVDKANRNVFLANYAGGSLTVVPVKADGSLAEPSQNVQDEGTGPDKARQEKPHVHTAVLSPDEKFVLYTDLGTDKVNVMKYNPLAAKTLTPAEPAYTSVTGGLGPRHIAFTPNSKFMYLITEMGGTINTYHYKNGQLKQASSQTILPDGFTGEIGAADIHISPDGKFLYSSNRGSVNELEVFSIDKDNGNLTFIQRTPSLGKTPRNFVLDPTGSFLLVANQNSDDVYVFGINKTTGKLTYTGNKLEVGNPTCLKFATID